MSEYLILAETILYKNNRLTCINTYDNFRTVAMPAEFNFDMVILCGPNWSVGEHKISVKAIASNGKELNLGTAEVKIPHEDFVYNAFLNNIRIAMDYSVSDLTFHVYDNGKELFSRKYPVLPMLVPDNPKNAPKDAPKQPEEEQQKNDSGSRFGTLENPKFDAFYDLKTKEDIDEALQFIEQIPDDRIIKSRLKEKVEKQREAIQ